MDGNEVMNIMAWKAKLIKQLLSLGRMHASQQAILPQMGRDSSSRTPFASCTMSGLEILILGLCDLLYLMM